MPKRTCGVFPTQRPSAPVEHLPRSVRLCLGGASQVTTFRAHLQRPLATTRGRRLKAGTEKSTNPGSRPPGDRTPTTNRPHAGVLHHACAPWGAPPVTSFRASEASRGISPDAALARPEPCPPPQHRATRARTALNLRLGVLQEGAIREILAASSKPVLKVGTGGTQVSEAVVAATASRLCLWRHPSAFCSIAILSRSATPPKGTWLSWPKPRCWTGCYHTWRHPLSEALPAFGPTPMPQGDCTMRPARLMWTSRRMITVYYSWYMLHF